MNLPQVTERIPERLGTYPSFPHDHLWEDTPEECEKWDDKCNVAILGKPWSCASNSYWFLADLTSIQILVTCHYFLVEATALFPLNCCLSLFTNLSAPIHLPSCLLSTHGPVRCYSSDQNPPAASHLFRIRAQTLTIASKLYLIQSPTLLTSFPNILSLTPFRSHQPLSSHAHTVPPQGLCTCHSFSWRILATDILETSLFTSFCPLRHVTLPERPSLYQYTTPSTTHTPTSTHTPCLSTHHHLTIYNYSCVAHVLHSLHLTVSPWEERLSSVLHKFLVVVSEFFKKWTLCQKGDSPLGIKTFCFIQG